MFLLNSTESEYMTGIGRLGSMQVQRSKIIQYPDMVLYH